MLVLSRRKNESLVINNDVTITVIEIRGDKVRLGVVSPKEVPVHRQEVWEAIHGRVHPQIRPSRDAEVVFLRAIAADPDDESARLVFADWLEERGDPLGDFLRTRCRLAKLAVVDAEHQALMERKRRLWVEHGAAWLTSLPSFLWSIPSSGCAPRPPS